MCSSDSGSALPILYTLSSVAAAFSTLLSCSLTKSSSVRGTQPLASSLASGLTTFEGWGWTRAIFFCCEGVMCGADDVGGGGAGRGVCGGGIGVGIDVCVIRCDMAG